MAASRTVAKAGTRMIVEGLAVGELLAEFGGACFQRLVGKGCDLGFKRVDGVDCGTDIP